MIVELYVGPKMGINVFGIQQNDNDVAIGVLNARSVTSSFVVPFYTSLK